MLQVLPLLAPSASFVVYCPCPQPLAECMHQLLVRYSKLCTCSHAHDARLCTAQVGQQAVMLQLQESWLRPYQVLPARTHPEMMCAGTGGFLLSGITVLPTAAAGPSTVDVGQQREGAGGRGRGRGRSKRGRQ